MQMLFQLQACSRCTYETLRASSSVAKSLARDGARQGHSLKRGSEAPPGANFPSTTVKVWSAMTSDGYAF